MDKSGNWIVEPNYDAASGFTNDFACISKITLKD
ncbi:WG repeat-containing protein [Caldicellulosiruptor owensensis]